MKEVKYEGEVSEEIVYYRKTENDKHGIHVQLEKIEESCILIYAYGNFTANYMDWEWCSEKIEIGKEGNTFRDGPIECDDGEIKGHILVNLEGDIIDMNFYPIVLALALRLEQTDGEHIISVLKEKIAITDQLPQIVKPIEFHSYGDPGAEERIKSFLKEKSFTNKKIKIMDPYISSSLINILKAVVPGDLKIEILTCKIGNSSDLPVLQNELSSFHSDVEIIIKKLIEEGDTVNITKPPPSNPFHDRCIISDNDILIIGTSFNSIIMNSTFISEMSNYPLAEVKFNEWFAGRIFTYNGRRLKFEQYYP